MTVMSEPKRFVLDVSDEVRRELGALLGGEKITLASGSPRRREILQLADVNCDVVIPEVDETIPDRADPREFALRIARHKLESTPDTRRLTVSADTIVVLGEQILGKPSSEQGAFEMLRLLSGQRHFVLTTLAIRTPSGKIAVDGEVTYVTFRTLGDESIRDYVRTGEPMDKAGAYGIQGMGELLVESLEGSLHNVIGFPIELFVRMLKEMR